MKNYVDPFRTIGPGMQVQLFYYQDQKEKIHSIMA
jgi:hypothetical protein